MAIEPSDVKVYTVNGATASSSSSLPDWLTRKRAAKGKGKRAVREHVEGTIELIQGFEFPEASNRIKTTRDGQFAIATGTYKPQMRVWDLTQLTLKFERHSDAENVDFVMLSDDWTKSIHLQNDRTVELHTQGGTHYRTRIPRFGRSIEYHFPSCDAYVAGAGNEIYRLNLDQGRTPTEDIPGVNTIDINPAHQLLAFGLEAAGSAQFWDPRSRSRVGLLRLPRNRLMPSGGGGLPLSVTAISSRADGLSYALGTSTGHTLLYDIRAGQPFALKDQGYGLPVTNVSWIEGGSRMAGDGMVLSADKKVIKIWDRHSPSTNFAAITPAADLNYVHHVPGSGLIMTANEGIQMATFYIPQLGPAPRWASFLENITEEMEDQTTRSVYEDYKFVERSELSALGLDHLVGTPTLKPYMHGYFLSLKLYDAARLIANPFAYTEYREKLVRERMEKLAETRIRSKKDGGALAGVKVNKALAEKILRDEERERKRAERRTRKRKDSEAADVDAATADADQMEVDGDEADEPASKSKPSLLTDPRFAKVFEDPAFAVDERSREYALMHPSAVAANRRGEGRQKTAVSSDGLGGGSDEDSDSDNDSDGSGSDSSDAGALSKFDRRARPGQKNANVEAAYNRTREQNRRVNQGNYVPMRATGSGGSKPSDREATFGQRRSGGGGTSQTRTKGKAADTFGAADGAMEFSWVPSGTSAGDDDGGSAKAKSKSRPGKGAEVFGAGMDRGGQAVEIAEQDRRGRTQRRKGVRSGSKNVFRRMEG
ncbi:NUC153 and WD40 repeat-containing nucleolar rRNA processing-related protein [Roridomyces roridus]|uniref:NUC153 and WD40 repeat-containing nucleolar rRNA processing-related protein n=1 Tax=Roridomyces roridus TaxID=1738132 RepID=A0AAD7FU06_9AGAR|nr:NUC153 and WD40 repeat-containing nucleolar rRNA processing-related protein [Roridomyces roridus]